MPVIVKRIAIVGTLVAVAVMASGCVPTFCGAIPCPLL